MLLTAWHFLPLQLGHARPRVETVRPFMVELAMSALQLGHARPRVETESFAGRTEQTSSCFNWATRVRAWKPVTLWCASSIVMSFNWATRVRAWKRQSGILCRNPYARFNWATRVRAWKLRCWGG